ncbi:hypothetical protein BH09VER1_BH09VER1_04980 [soil metagenome]
MKFLNVSPLFRTLSLLAVSLLALGFTAGSALAADEFSFKVENKTEDVIKKVLVSEDGRSYAPFDIGKGIKPGQTVTLVWDKSTNNEACKQWVKAVYDDGSETKPAKFDFCEADLEIVFE